MFIFEGPDGVGKSTLSSLFAELIRSKGRSCELMSFPGREPGTIGSIVYALHHTPAAFAVEEIAPAALQALHVAAHLDSIALRILPAIEAGKDVVLDRYWWSTAVYGAVDGANTKLLSHLIDAERVAWGDVVPERIFLLQTKKPLRPLLDVPRWRRLARQYKTFADGDGVTCIANFGTPEDALRRIEEAVNAAEPPCTELNRIDFHIGLSPAKPTKVLDTYWRFAAERQEVFFKRLNGDSPPWTNDPIIGEHRFTNSYRASDRVSQYLIKSVQYGMNGPYDAEDLVFRTLFFKLFNRIETWQLIHKEVGDPTWSGYSFKVYDRLLSETMSRGERIYSAAYIMPPGGHAFGHTSKHRNHLALIEHMMDDGIVERLSRCRRMQDVFVLLRSYPTLGDFLAYQFATDLNYSEVLDFSEMDFVVPGPGALDGLKKCFSDPGGLTEPELIRLVADIQEAEFQRLGIAFRDLFGRRLQLIDCQNLFCEVDKYARVAHPDMMGISGRTRIKQKFVQGSCPTSAWYPPKWGINDRIPSSDNGTHEVFLGGLFKDANG